MRIHSNLLEVYALPLTATAAPREHARMAAPTASREGVLRVSGKEYRVTWQHDEPTVHGERGRLNHLAPATDNPRLYLCHHGYWRDEWFAPWGKADLRLLKQPETAWRAGFGQRPDLLPALQAWDETEDFTAIELARQLYPRIKDCPLTADELMRVVAGVIA